VCVVAYEGPDCSKPRDFPNNLSARFEGDFIITQRHVVESRGVNFTTNPKAGGQVTTNVY
jgi:hypothetical protein